MQYGVPEASRQSNTISIPGTGCRYLEMRLKMLARIISSKDAGSGLPLHCSTRRRVRPNVLPRNATPHSSGVIGYPRAVRVSDIARSARASLSTTTPSLSKTTSPQRAPLTCSTLPVAAFATWKRFCCAPARERPYALHMGTEDDLKRLGQAAAALASVAAARAKEAAEQLLGSGEKAREWRQA